MQALLVVQDPDEAAVLALVLQRAGLAVTHAKSLEHNPQIGPEYRVDLVMLASPRYPAPTEIRRLRAETQLPLMLIVGPVDEEVHAELLMAGADIVIGRPYSARLLIAQTRALLRRAAGVPFFTLPEMSVEGLTLDPANRTVEVDGNPPKRLTQLEFRLLYTLMVHRGQVLPTETLTESVWGYTGEGSRELVRGLVSRLRAKIETDPHNPRRVLTVPGVGYILALRE